MKRLLFALAFLSSTASSKALDMNINAFPGKVVVQVDLGVSTSVGPTDVLFVVDDSASMIVHQNNLANNIPILVEGLIKSTLDFHAGVITSDTSVYTNTCCGKLIGQPNFVTRKTPNAAQILSKNLKPGTNGSGIEMFFETTRLALSEPMLSTINNGFYRKNANLAIVMLTDAEDQSKMTVAEMVSFMDALKPDRKHITVQTLNVPTDVKDCDRDDPGMRPVRIEELVKTYNGASFNLCAPNYPDQVKQITDNIIANAGTGTGLPYIQVSRIPLPSAPDFKSIRVTYGMEVLAGGDPELGWIYNRAKNEVVLGTDIDWSTQPVGTLLEVSYVPADWK